MPVQHNTLYGTVGVSIHRATGKYRAYITINGKSKHLGLFDTLDEACEARENANLNYGYHANHGK